MEIADGWTIEEIGRSRGGLPLRLFVPEGLDRVDGLLIAGIHGEEPETLLLARRLLERVDGGDTTWAILPAANPDGILAGTRQNAAGVDLNRNFPASSWSADASFTYPPGTLERRRPHRTNRSSPGDAPGSEPETQALLAVIEHHRPALILDLHSPLALIAPTPAADAATVRRLADHSDLPVRADIGSPTPGALRDWCTDHDVAAVTYEVEHAALPALCARHLPPLEGLLRR